MSRALVVQHSAVEGVGRFAEWLPEAGVELRVVRPYEGQALPVTVTDDALIVMGGPMGAHDDADVAWLSATKALLADAVERGVPTLGVCLGAQLLAVATGGDVQRGDAGPELGLDTVDIAVADRLFEPATIPVVQWHNDTVVRLPADATLLGSSERYAIQAFRVGECAWGMQFHVEATAAMVAEWARAERMAHAGLAGPVAESEGRLGVVGQQLARRFAALIG